MRLVIKTKAGQTITYDYSAYDSVKIAAQPSSNIDWPQFASTQLQIEAQASNLLSPTQHDAVRQSSLAA
ncbi:MAG: hypothetical protein ABIV43_03555, partial [Candidatus Saccharimonadales bacterium]